MNEYFFFYFSKIQKHISVILYRPINTWAFEKKSKLAKTHPNTMIIKILNLIPIQDMNILSSFFYFHIWKYDKNVLPLSVLSKYYYQ